MARYFLGLLQLEDFQGDPPQAFDEFILCPKKDRSLEDSGHKESWEQTEISSLWLCAEKFTLCSHTPATDWVSESEITLISIGRKEHTIGIYKGLAVLALWEDLAIWVTALQIIWINDAVWRRVFQTAAMCQNPFKKFYAILALSLLLSGTH